MGVNFIIMIENVAKRTQEEIDKEFGAEILSDGTILHNWELFTYKGKEYAQWDAPRFFVKREDPARWEAIRKHLVRAMKFFGAKEVLETNDVCWFGFPPEEMEDHEERPGYYFPGPMWYKDLEEPDYEKFPELKDVEELENIKWYKPRNT